MPNHADPKPITPPAPTIPSLLGESPRLGGLRPKNIFSDTNMANTPIAFSKVLPDTLTTIAPPANAPATIPTLKNRTKRQSTAPLRWWVAMEVREVNTMVAKTLQAPYETQFLDQRRARLKKTPAQAPSPCLRQSQTDRLTPL